jgi:hypothetical protein
MERLRECLPFCFKGEEIVEEESTRTPEILNSDIRVSLNQQMTEEEEQIHSDQQIKEISLQFNKIA